MRKRIGIYCLATGGGGAAKSCAVAAQRLSRDHDVSLIVAESAAASQLESYYAVDLSRVRLVCLSLPVQNALRRWSANAPSTLRGPLDLIRAKLGAALECASSRQIRALGLDLLMNKQPRSILPCPASRGIYLCMFPREMKGELQRDPARGVFHRASAAFENRLAGMTDEVLDSYQIIAANSSYTAQWIERLWRRKSTVVYSSCEDMGPPAPKEKIILHVGRFTSPWRNDYKHQRTLLDLYRGMPSLHQQGWRLHFAGTLEATAGAGREFAQLQRDAAGLPVEFHPSTRFELLRGLYRRASIYWHATGFGSLHPGKQEHFGMAVVEAMSAGAVPVVLNSGGPRETVQHQDSGFRWNSLPELQRYTELLAFDPALLRQFSGRATAWSRQFHRAAFEDRIEMLADSLLRRNV